MDVYPEARPVVKFYHIISISLIGLSVAAARNEDATEPESAGEVRKRAVVHDFESDDAASQWITVNDNVMGGRSKGGFEVKNGKLIFTGSTNTAGGGFSSIRTSLKKLDFKGREGVIIRLRGDGRTYKFDVRMGRNSVAHRADFKTEKDTDSWQTVKIPFASLSPTWRGRRLPRLLNKLKKPEIQSLGFMIYDKKDGPFELKVDWIKSY
jgi:NADH dehydrogenase [ubiquinone] 1 alpha subcomplex assembly factor 1